MKTIILASTSLRRKEFLEKLGLKFKVVESGYKENMNLPLSPPSLARFLSKEKARAVIKRFPQSLVIAADTVVVCRGQIIGKPRTKKEAVRMLRLLSGRYNFVFTGFTVIDGAKQKTVTRVVKTKVYFRKLAPSEIKAYVRSGEPFGKAGAYAIQGLGAIFIKKIEGDYSNVVGLPLHVLSAVLKKFNVSIL
ncbi:MAG: septum formation inhibitor Maf [Candidatus Sungiibacteriota bacterium]|uniref:dTTP/UTP pyrophosphatase n=1 Tax=Candidatus Sungiibacteriota bacterium TaxID=2750080 RepID=A0A7T5URA0_9BACT|nr:MAG: septum formation inhibitor Maf [Candidatus Sungbacteria bacterium]